MVTETKEKKNLKLGNWQVFLLDKLYQLYTKGDLCDVTLKFSDEKSIQAHKVVLTACTNFFEHLPSSSSGLVLHMPKAMKAHHVKPIINFMYTGKLEFMSEDQAHIFIAAKNFGMNVLTELLQVQQQPSLKKCEQRSALRKYIQKHVPARQTQPEQSNLTPQPPPVPESTPTAALPGKKKPLPTVVDELPRPTRFEWHEEEGLPDITLTQSISVDSFEHLSYDSKIIVKPVDDPKPVISEDSIDIMPASTHVIHGAKRRVSEVVKGRSDDDDDYDDGHFESIHDLEDDFETEEPVVITNVKPVLTPPKPILKTHEVSTPTPSKKVRFSFSTENETAIVNQSDTPPPAETSLTLSAEPLSQTISPMQTLPAACSTPMATTASNTPSVNSLNHAKIINEILRKYPNLVKSNKNIKLKIQSGATPGSSPQNIVTLDKDKKGQKKIQYVVLKSDIANVKKETKSEVMMGVENRTGPWLCASCANDNGPLNFETYYTYRKHLQEVHNERVDARICEHCGFKASKRNLHLYHLYTKHNIPPPRNINFPKCDQCNYIALSESLLIKHRSNHIGMINKEFVCRLCNAAFKSNGALMGHMQTNLHNLDHSSAKKYYECEFCGKVFNRNINLKAHIRTSHQEENRKMYDDEDKTDDPPEVEAVPEQRNQNVMEVIEVPVFDTAPSGNKTLYLPQGMTILAESPAVPLMPSSESEAMSNVATGIATSINITDRNMPNDVIVIDGHSEIILRGTPATYVLNQDGSYSVQEYIVPEIMADSGQVYTTALVSTAPATGINYVNSDNISIITTSTDHTYADGMKINGNVSTGTQNSLSSNGTTVITPQVQGSQSNQPIIVQGSQSNQPIIVQGSQSNQPIIVQEPIIMSADWIQSIATSQAQSLNLGQGPKVEIISAPVTQVSSESPLPHQADPVAQARTAQTLVSDWGDLEDDNQEDSRDGEDESDMKPSRPTIELDVSTEMEM